MNRLLNELAEGHCCIHRYLMEEVAPKPVWRAAEIIGVTERTIYNWRRRIIEGDILMCDECLTQLVRGDVQKVDPFSPE
jgi:hypothetical protein